MVEDKEQDILLFKCKVSNVNCLALDDSDVDYFLTQSYFLITTDY